MFLLNELKDFCLYNNRIIAGCDKDSKNSRKDIAFIIASMNIEQTFQLYNNLLYKNNFKSFYVPYRFHTIKTKKSITLDQKTIYSNVKLNIPTVTNYRKELDLYKKSNLLYDLSYETKYIMSELNIKGLKYINFYMDFLSLKYTSLDYTNKIIAVPVPEDVSLSGLTVNNNENPFTIIYLSMYKNIVPKELNDTTFLFYNKNGSFVKFKYNSDLKKSDIMKAFSKITKVSKSNNSEPVVEDEPPKPISNSENIITNQINKDDIIDGIKVVYLKKLGVQVNSTIGDELQTNVNDLLDIMDDKIGKLNIDFSRLTSEDILKLLMTEPEILKQSKIVSDLATKGRVSDMYVKKLKDKQDSITFNGKSLPEILNSVKNLSIEEDKLENNEVVNEEVTRNRTLDFDKSYYDKQREKDMINIFTAFNNDEDVKLFVRDIKVENTSDMFTKKMTYTITFQDENKNTHNFKINYPILKDGKYLIAGGGRKLILKQLLLLPIVKTKPDTVQITTNYNKLFIYRFGDKLSDGTEFIKKLLLQDLSDHIIKGSRFNYRRGNTSGKNKGFDISLEYKELSRNFSFIENKEFIISFNQLDIKKEIENKNIEMLSDYTNVFPAGFIKSKNEIIYIDKNTGEVFIRDGKDLSKINDNLTYFIIENIFKPSLSEIKMKEFYSFNPTKTLAYNRAKITGRTIPIIILLSYEKGLKNILDRYGIDYEFIKSERVPKEFGKKRMKFEDGYLVYSSLDLKSTLLLDGLTLIDTSSWTFNQMNTKEPYIEYFNDFHGSRNIGKGLHNMLSLMVDPITKEVLEDLDLPTNIIDIILYANTLLSTSSYKMMNDMSCYRLRGAEQVNAVLYKILADAFKTYKDTSNNGNPIKISVDPDILIKQLNGLKTVDEYSILNPSLEIDKGSSVTYKGPSGK